MRLGYFRIGLRRIDFRLRKRLQQLGNITDLCIREIKKEQLSLLASVRHSYVPILQSQ